MITITWELSRAHERCCRRVKDYSIRTIRLLHSTRSSANTRTRNQTQNGVTPFWRGGRSFCSSASASARRARPASPSSAARARAGSTRRASASRGNARSASPPNAAPAPPPRPAGAASHARCRRRPPPPPPARRTCSFSSRCTPGMRPPAGRFKPRYDRYLLLVEIVWVGSLFLRLVDFPLQLAPAISFFTRYDRLSRIVAPTSSGCPFLAGAIISFSSVRTAIDDRFWQNTLGGERHR